jgi:hypothetical protein
MYLQLIPAFIMTKFHYDPHVRLVFWSAVAAGGLGLTKKSSQLSFRAESVARHINSFVERRVVRPLTK